MARRTSTRSFGAGWFMRDFSLMAISYHEWRDSARRGGEAAGIVCVCCPRANQSYFKVKGGARSMRAMETMPAGSPAHVDKQEVMKAKRVPSKY